MAQIKIKEILRKSRKQESRTAQTLGGKTQPGSGNQWHSPGDVKTSHWLISNKYTDARQFSLRVKDFVEISDDSFHADRSPAMEILFRKSGMKLYVIDENMMQLFNSLLEGSNGVV